MNEGSQSSTMSHREDFTVRKASKEDLPAVYAIEKRSFKDPYPPFLIDILLKTDSETFLVAEKEKEILGYVVASKDRNVGNIVSIAVSPEVRGRGIGSRLLLDVLHILKKSGVESVRLEVRKSNTYAQRFYEHLGFVYSHDAPGYYGDEDAKVYYKNLTK
ncbi:MAG: ribosomal protein S18-alanine N-acetyltransferase [Candidatus Bathyarchaeia archaeon]